MSTYHVSRLNTIAVLVFLSVCPIFLQDCTKNDLGPTEPSSNQNPGEQPPNPPALVFPSNGSTGVPLNPTLSWNRVNEATTYRLQVSQSGNYSSLIIDQIITTGTSLTLQGLAKKTTYYWRVSASNSYGEGAYSGSSNFTTIEDQTTITDPSTTFIESPEYNVPYYGGWWINSFTIYMTTNFVVRFATQYAAQAAVITSDQLSNFKSMSAFNGYSVFDKQFGTQYVTLTPGTYYLAVRNSSSSSNKWTIELDYRITLPASDRSTYYDNYVHGVQSFANGGKMWQGFSIQSGYRYFLDGCNIGFSTYIIPASQLNAFKAGQSFNSYTVYDQPNDSAAPGQYEIKLPPGDYYLVANGIGSCSITYTMERWKVN